MGALRRGAGAEFVAARPKKAANRCLVCRGQVIGFHAYRQNCPRFGAAGEAIQAKRFFVAAEIRRGDVGGDSETKLLLARRAVRSHLMPENDTADASDRCTSQRLVEPDERAYFGRLSILVGLCSNFRLIAGRSAALA